MWQEASVLQSVTSVSSFLSAHFHHVSSSTLTLDVIKTSYSGRHISILCPQRNVSSFFSSQHYINENKKIQFHSEKRMRRHWWALNNAALYAGTGWLCPQESPRYNVVKWLITLTWTHHADISSCGRAEELNKQCRRQAGWADKARTNKSFDSESELQILFTQTLRHRQLDPPPQLSMSPSSHHCAH